MICRWGQCVLVAICIMMATACLELTPDSSQRIDYSVGFWMDVNSRSSAILEDMILKDGIVSSVSRTLATHEGDTLINVNFVSGEKLQFFKSIQTESLRYTIQDCDVIDVIDHEYTVDFCLHSGSIIDFPRTELYSLVKKDVPRQGFYKDIFLDAGVGLTSRNSLYAATYLGLSLEYVDYSRYDASSAEIDSQNSIFGGNEEDLNGRLLYPDGQPRYKVLFVNGGSSQSHGKSLTKQSRLNMRNFVLGGGSYVGTCAGAFFASSGYDDNHDYQNYLHLWPATVKHTGLNGVRTGMTIEHESPLLNYFDFGGDMYVGDIRHNKGGYPASLPIGTIVLARFDYPVSNVHGEPSAWSYKSSPNSGMLVLESSHPEEVKSGEIRDFTSAMILYAIDNVGFVTPKGYLHNGIIRSMDKSSYDNCPAFSKIGDLQYHHFVTFIPNYARKVIFSIYGNDSCDLTLRVSHFSFPFAVDDSEIEYCCSVNESIELEGNESGLYYVSVQNSTIIDSHESEYCLIYDSNTEALNGTSYSLLVRWEN